MKNIYFLKHKLENKKREKAVFLQQEGSCCKLVEAFFPSPLLTAQNVLHPSSRCGRVEKTCFFPWKDSVLFSLCVPAPQRAAHVSTRASLTPSHRLSAHSAPLLHTNQGDSHPRRNGVKSTFVGQVGSPLRAQPDA